MKRETPAELRRKVRELRAHILDQDERLRTVRLDAQVRQDEMRWVDNILHELMAIIPKSNELHAVLVEGMNARRQQIMNGVFERARLRSRK